MWYTQLSLSYDPQQLQRAVNLLLVRLNTNWNYIQTKHVPEQYEKTRDLVGINLTHPLDVDADKRIWGLNAPMDWIKVNRGYGEEHYTEFLSEAKGTYLEGVVNDLRALSPQGQARIQLSWLPVGVETFWGRSDITGHGRVHIPIYTPKDAYILGPDQKAYHWPADGQVYQFSSRQDHKMVNADTEPQLHLIAYLAD